MVCRACRVPTSVTPSQTVVYASGTLLLAISIFMGIFLNRFLQRRQRKHAENLRAEDLLDVMKDETNEYTHHDNNSTSSTKEDMQTQLREGLEETTITVSGPEFQQCVSRLAHNSVVQ